MASITKTVDGLAVLTPYDGAFLTELKQVIPASDRRWSKPIWIIDPKHESKLVNLVKSYFIHCELTESPEVRQGGLMLVEAWRAKVAYIGACKPRDGGESSAYGWAMGDWNIVFPETVLRQFFNAGPVEARAKSVPNTLYGLLGLSKSVDHSEIKSAYRRAARQWHPDVNSDPDAKQIFQKIANAYEVLSDPMKRKRYDAGLALESSVSSSNSSNFDLAELQSFYRAPYTCGLIQFKGKRRLGRWLVEEITRWDDITDDSGQIMVSSWDKLNNTFKVSWVDPEPDFEVSV